MTTQPSAPGPDYTGEVAAAIAAPGLAGVPNLMGANTGGHAEYRVSPEGDVTPTSGSSLADVVAAPLVDPPGPAPADASLGTVVNPVDVSAMGGGTRQWWVSPEDAVDTQATADAINATPQPPGADVGGTPGGWQPFPPGPDGMVAQ